MFPQKLSISPLFLRELEQLFPMLDWSKLIIKEKLPWFVLRKYARALAIPHIFSRQKSSVYVAKDVVSIADFERIVVHELTHIYQYQTIGNRGFGLFRNGFVLYVYLFFKHGYYLHPMEVSARNMEEQWLQFKKTKNQALFDQALQTEGQRMSAIRKDFSFWQKLGFLASFPATFLLQGLLFLLSFPGQLIFLIGLVGVFQKRSNG